MILSDNQIKERLATNSLRITPLAEDQLQGVSVDLCLADNFLKIKDHSLTHLDDRHPALYDKITTSDIVIAPHSFILASTVETLAIPDDLAAIVEGRSSIGRMGLFIQNAGLVTPGFKGNLTLELYNANNMALVLKAGMKICQLLFMPLSSPTSLPYRGKYQNQQNVTGSRLFEEKEQVAQTSSDNLTAESAVKNPTSDEILVAADHAGYELKTEILAYLTAKNLAYRDLGTESQEKSVDYPDYAAKLAKLISADQKKQGILVCGSGIGMSIAANRFSNVRAALCNDEKTASLARQHNDANVLVLSGRTLPKDNLASILDAWLSVKFEGGRHQRRVASIEKMNL